MFCKDVYRKEPQVELEMYSSAGEVRREIAIGNSYGSLESYLEVEATVQQCKKDKASRLFLRHTSETEM